MTSRFLLFPILLLALFSTSTLVSADDKCRILVLQGGGDKGAYEAGVLSGFLHNTNNTEDFTYNVVTGVSVGAINGLNFGQFPLGQETQAADYLVGVWHNTSKSNVYVDWPFGIAQGLLLKPSLYDSTPEDTYLRNNVLAPPSKRNVTVVSTDANTGKKVSFNDSFWGNDVNKAMDAALYSSAVPILFLYKNLDNYTLVDGGWSGEGIDVEDAINNCRQIVDDDTKIIVDIIFANNISFTDVIGEGYNTLQVLNRYSSIWSYISAVRTYEYSIKDYPGVDFRYAMIASERLPNQDVPLDFNATNINHMIELGVKDAIKALNEGPKAHRERILEEIRRFKF